MLHSVRPLMETIAERRERVHTSSLPFVLENDRNTVQSTEYLAEYLHERKGILTRD